MKIIIRIALLVFVFFCASSCVTPISRLELENGLMAVGKLAAIEMSSVMIPSLAFYAKNSRWPNTIDELRESISEGIEELEEKEALSEMEMFPLAYPRFDNAEFETLPNGGLKITLQEYTYESGLTTGKMSFTLSASGIKKDTL